MASTGFCLILSMSYLFFQLVITGPADYSAISMQFIFTPTNQNDQLCVNIPIINDVICEGDEVFTVSLTSNDDCVSIQMPSQGSVTIVDDDGKYS